MNAVWGIKGIMIIGVVLLHMGYPMPDLMTFFFVVSGFTSAYSMCNEKSGGVFGYYKRKISKLYPAYLFSFLMSLPLAFLQNGEKIENFLNYKWGVAFFTKLFLLDSYFPQGEMVFFFNGLSWFLSSLCFFYLIIPVIWNWIERRKWKQNIYEWFLIGIFICGIVIGIDLLVQGDSVDYSVAWWYIYISPYYRVLQCLFGFCFGMVFLQIKDYMDKHRIKGEKVLFTILEAVVIYAEIIIVYGKIADANGIKCIGHIFLLIVLGMRKGLISEFLSLKFFVRIGKLNLYIYLFHLLILNYFYILVGGPISKYNKDSWLMMYLLFLIICVAETLDKYFSRRKIDLKSEK